MVNDRQRAIEMFDAKPKPTAGAVARAIGRPVSTVQYWARRADIELAKPGRPTDDPAGKSERYWYCVPATVNEHALDVLAGQGIDSIKALVQGIANGRIAVEIK